MFRIGEFSKIAQIPVSQLHYYDRIGLFQPDHTDKFNGYRAYSINQLPDLNRILALKELGLTLDQIRRMVHDDVSAKEIRGMLALRKAHAEICSGPAFLFNPDFVWQRPGRRPAADGFIKKTSARF